MTSIRSFGRSQLLRDVWPVLALILVAGFVLMWKIGAGSLAAWDEVIYAEVSREVLGGNDWLTLHWAYQPWFEKPPLFIWITALFFKLFSVSEFWARLPSALSGVALVMLTYAIGRVAYSRRISILASVILLTCYQFVSFARFGTMEVMLALFVYLAIYGYLRVKDDKPQWWYLVWSACALALMVKGAGGIIAPATIVIALLFDHRFKPAIQSREFWLGLVVGVILVAPWHLLMYAWYGRAFMDEYFGYHVIARATRTLEGNRSSYFYFVGKLLDGFFPWVLLTPFALVAFVRARTKDRKQSWILLVLSVLVFGAYTLIPTRRPWYIVPIYPALSLIFATFLIGLYEALRRPVARRIIAFAYVALIFAGGAYTLVSVYLNHKPAEPVAKLARLTQNTNPADTDSLLVFSEAEPFYPQVPLFYSHRIVQQTFASSKPASEDAPRYANYQNLTDATRNSTKQIILRKADIGRLTSHFDIRVLAEDGPFVYGTIRPRL